MFSYLELEYKSATSKVVSDTDIFKVSTWNATLAQDFSLFVAQLGGTIVQLEVSSTQGTF